MHMHMHMYLHMHMHMHMPHDTCAYAVSADEKTPGRASW